MKNKHLAKVLFVLGGPGCGKGTQCEYLSKVYGFQHFSAGDLLREEVKKEGELSKSINQHIANGTIVPGEITAQLLVNAIISNNKDNLVFIIDGFPRNLSNLEAWNYAAKDQVETLGVLYLKCSEEIMLQRMLKRAENSGRIDDNEEVFKKRIHVFNNETSQTLKHFESIGQLYEVSAEESLEKCEENVSKIITGLKLDKINKSFKISNYLQYKVDPFMQPLMNYFVLHQPKNIIEAIKYWLETEGMEIQKRHPVND